MAVTYTVRWRPTGADPGDAWSEETGLTEASYAVTGLTAGVQYDVEVIAVSGGVPSPATEGSSWTRCAAPTSVTTAGVLAETATVSWTGVTGATAYRIERSTDAATWTTAATTLDGATTSLGVTGLTESQGYQFRVVAENSVGDSAASAASAQITTSAIGYSGSTEVIGTFPNQYRVHRFAATGSTGFSLNAARDVEYLLVGGGGGGGARHGGGGGGGGMLTGTLSALAVGTYTVTVGGGGVGAKRDGPGGVLDPVPAADGGSTTFVGTAVGLTALGGGAGGSWSDVTVSKRNGANGGSGGGAAVGDDSGSPGAGLQPGSTNGGRGNRGGNPVAARSPGTGGGGAGAVGGDNGAGDGTATGGNGGAGFASSITGSEVYYAGGGGGAGSGTAGTGGVGGGGNGASGNSSGSDGENWLGGGGGGARSETAEDASCVGGKGGAGVLILRYRLTPGA